MAGMRDFSHKEIGETARHCRANGQGTHWPKNDAQSIGVQNRIAAFGARNHLFARQFDPQQELVAMPERLTLSRTFPSRPAKAIFTNQRR